MTSTDLCRYLAAGRSLDSTPERCVDQYRERADEVAGYGWTEDDDTQEDE